MSEQINNGGSAFPVQDAASWQAHGMTLRDYLAAKAMQAALMGVIGWGPCELLADIDTDKVAQFADMQARAMLAARGDA